jgi:hypothetical protein
VHMKTSCGPGNLVCTKQPGVCLGTHVRHEDLCALGNLVHSRQFGGRLVNWCVSGNCV